MNIKNKLIPLMLFAVAACVAVYYYMIFPSVAVFGEGLSSNLCSTDYYLPLHSVSIFISFFTVFVALGILQNKICSFAGAKKTALIPDSINNENPAENKGI